MTHIPVLKDESIDRLNIHEGDVIVDGTLGGGGHTFEILEDDTIICEQKNGPYYGQELDKKFINDEK